MRPKLALKRALGPDKLLLNFFVDRPVGGVHLVRYARLRVGRGVVVSVFYASEDGLGLIACLTVGLGMPERRDGREAGELPRVA